MTVFQLLMLGASAYFAFKIYEHIQTLQEPDEKSSNSYERDDADEKSVNTFSPFSSEDLVEKADNAFEEEDYTKALALLTEANVKDANNPDIIFKIAYILQKSGDNDEALKYYKEALELDKKNEYIHNSMASIYRENREFTSAKMHIHASLDIDSQNPVTYYNYGNLLVDMQHNEEAIEMYKKALEINPDFEEAKQELETLEK
ncbi:MAG: tetratricopeptide repeat protein [Campylobacterota bacterium]|nr:tetratricopeptide repeat protein [Campylobacterota bacterium]